MLDYLEIGSVPCNESCQQVGTADYDPIKARAECRQFIIAIRRELGPEPDGARLAVASNNHDFGTYYDVVCHYNDNLESTVEYAYKCEAEAPEDWTDEDRAALGI